MTGSLTIQCSDFLTMMDNTDVSKNVSVIFESIKIHYLINIQRKLKAAVSWLWVKILGFFVYLFVAPSRSDLTRVSLILWENKKKLAKSYYMSFFRGSHWKSIFYYFPQMI